MRWSRATHTRVCVCVCRSVCLCAVLFCRLCGARSTECSRHSHVSIYLPLCAVHVQATASGRVIDLARCAHHFNVSMCSESINWHSIENKWIFVLTVYFLVTKKNTTRKKCVVESVDTAKDKHRNCTSSIKTHTQIATNRLILVARSAARTWTELMRRSLPVCLVGWYNDKLEAIVRCCFFFVVVVVCDTVTYTFCDRK